MPTKLPKMGSLFAVLVIAVLPHAYAADAEKTDGVAKSSVRSSADMKMIRSAMQAAPKKVSQEATIATMDKDGRMRVLREGTNGFICMPDNPATPGPDPMCMDRAAMEWVNAWVGRKTPPAGKVGFMYMLAGGTDASNTDPFATKPAPGNNWVSTGPHVMIVGADASFYDMYPKAAKPDTSGPYVMWAGTPYQHLMIPVK